MATEVPSGVDGLADELAALSTNNQDHEGTDDSESGKIHSCSWSSTSDDDDDELFELTPTYSNEDAIEYNVAGGVIVLQGCGPEKGENIDCKGGTFSEVYFKGCTFGSINFDNCILDNVVFENCTIDRTTFSNVVLTNMEFTGCNFEETMWQNHKDEGRWVDDKSFRGDRIVNKEVPEELNCKTPSKLLQDDAAPTITALDEEAKEDSNGKPTKDPVLFDITTVNCQSISKEPSVTYGGGYFENVSFSDCKRGNTTFKGCFFKNVDFINCTFNNTTWTNLYLRDVIVENCFFVNYVWTNGSRITDFMASEGHVGGRDIGYERHKDIVVFELHEGVSIKHV